jgi:NADP-dependent 3-hydroxy acid dehydrogenase YdfG
MRVCVVDVNGDAARAVADEIGGLAVTADVSDSAQVDAAFAAYQGFGGIDCLSTPASRRYRISAL